MDFRTALLLLTSIAYFLLSLYVFSKGKEKTLNQTLSLLALAIAAWNFGQAMGEIEETKMRVLFWTRFNVGAVVMVPAFYLHFIMSLIDPRGKRKTVIRVAYLASLVLVILVMTPLFIKDVAPIFGFKFYPQPGIAYSLFIVYACLIFIYSFMELVLTLRRLVGEQFRKVLYVFAAALIGFLGGVTLFFPLFGVNFPTLSHLFMPISVVMMVYAILRHQLLDITIFVRKGLVYSLITALFTGIYIIALLILQSFTRYNSVIATPLIVFGMVLIFQPVRDRLQLIIDHAFFKSYYDYQETVSKISQQLSTVLRTNELFTIIQTKLLDALKAKRVEILLGDAKPSFEITLTVPIESKGHRLGTLFLGPKLSGDDYLPEDINLLKTLASQVAVAMENIQLYQKLLRSENLAALGTMAAGMAHEIKNPLAAIKGMTQVLPENLDDKKFITDYTEVVPRQLDRINRIIENLLKAGRAPKPEKKEVDINHLLNEVIDFYANLWQKQKVEVCKKLMPLPRMLADPDQLQQVFTNLVLNAIQAMPDGGSLTVDSQGRENLVVIKVTDTGLGIPADKLEKIFDPFYSLKEEGTGLGLFTAYRIIQEHGGSIDVESQENKGTTFSLCLPIKPKASV